MHIDHNVIDPNVIEHITAYSQSAEFIAREYYYEWRVIDAGTQFIYLSVVSKHTSIDVFNIRLDENNITEVCIFGSHLLPATTPYDEHKFTRYLKKNIATVPYDREEYFTSAEIMNLITTEIARMLTIIIGDAAKCRQKYGPLRSHQGFGPLQPHQSYDRFYRRYMYRVPLHSNEIQGYRAPMRRPLSISADTIIWEHTLQSNTRNILSVNVRDIFGVSRYGSLEIKQNDSGADSHENPGADQCCQIAIKSRKSDVFCDLASGDLITRLNAMTSDIVEPIRGIMISQIISVVEHICDRDLIGQRDEINKFMLDMFPRTYQKLYRRKWYHD